jgi:hypothetical protein
MIFFTQSFKIHPVKPFIHFIILFSFFLPFLFSCSPSKKVIRAPLKEEGSSYLFSQLKNNEIRYNGFSAKFSARYTIDKKEISFNGQIRIKKDSIIWISVSPALGIEMMRLLFTNDSIKYVNRIESTYLLADFQYITKLINNALDLDMLQAFLTGNDFSFYENTEFKASIDNQDYKLATIQRHKLKKYIKESAGDIVIPFQDIWLDSENFKITKVLIREVMEGSRKFEAIYSDFISVDGQILPTQLDFNIKTDEKSLSISISYSRIEIDKPTKYPFSIPDKYIRIL